MSYFSPSIPQASDDPKVSQGQLLGNFGKINTDYAVDHVALTASINNGLHKKITFEDVQTLNPDLPADLASLYTKAVSSANELFFQNNNTSSDVYQLTNLPVSNVGTNYSIITPWGLKLQMGLSTGTTITFADQFSVNPPTIYFIGLTGKDATNPKVTSINDQQLVFSASSGTLAYYLVIGLP